MMYEEFIELSGHEVSYDQYTDKIEPIYTIFPQMTKREFVDFIAPISRKMAKEYKVELDAWKRKNTKPVFVSEGRLVPNGSGYWGAWGKVLDYGVNVRTGKRKMKISRLTPDEQRETGWPEYSGFWIDIDLRDPRTTVIWVD